MRHENPLSGSWSTYICQKGSGGPQKPFSWLSEGVRGVFTTNTEAGERTYVPAFLSSGRDHRVLVIGGAGKYCSRNSSS